MQKAYLELNGVRTSIQTWGRWVEESSPDNNNEIIVIIPGNPGVTGFYTTFGKALHEKTNLPVWCVGHAGHTIQKNSVQPLPGLKENRKLFGLRGQIDNKIDFFDKYIPNNAKVHLIGHSIGSYIIVEMLENASVRNKVKSVELLFPTIEYMAETGPGKLLLTLSYIQQLIYFVGWFFSILPSIIQYFLIYCYCFITGLPFKENYNNIVDLMNAKSLRRIFFMAYEELDQVKKRNESVLRNNLDKIHLLYGMSDGWAPISYHDNLKIDIPEAKVSTTTCNHSFVVYPKQSKELANIVYEMINET